LVLSLTFLVELFIRTEKNINFAIMATKKKTKVEQPKPKAKTAKKVVTASDSSNPPGTPPPPPKH
jgi:hypothetical protein